MKTKYYGKVPPDGQETLSPAGKDAVRISNLTAEDYKNLKQEERHLPQKNPAKDLTLSKSDERVLDKVWASVAKKREQQAKPKKKK